MDRHRARPKHDGTDLSHSSGLFVDRNNRLPMVPSRTGRARSQRAGRVYPPRGLYLPLPSTTTVLAVPAGQRESW